MYSYKISTAIVTVLMSLFSSLPHPKPHHLSHARCSDWRVDEANA